jgi:hypothetical protein
MNFPVVKAFFQGGIWLSEASPNFTSSMLEGGVGREIP